MKSEVPKAAAPQMATRGSKSDLILKEPYIKILQQKSKFIFGTLTTQYKTNEEDIHFSWLVGP